MAGSPVEGAGGAQGIEGGVQRGSTGPGSPGHPGGSPQPQWVVDLRLHSLSGLPSAESTVEVRLRTRALELPSAEAQSFDGVVFLGSWTRLRAEGGEAEVALEVRCGRGRGRGRGRCSNHAGPPGVGLPAKSRRSARQAPVPPLCIVTLTL